MPIAVTFSTVVTVVVVSALVVVVVVDVVVVVGAVKTNTGEESRMARLPGLTKNAATKLALYMTPEL